MRVTFSHFVVGVVMGMADLVPGVSGGTIAFVSGRYERLVAAIHSFDVPAVGMIRRRTWTALGRRLDLGFLLPLLLGIGTAVVALAGTLDGWLGDQVARPRLFSFFAGLVVASAIVVGRRLRWSPALVGAAATGGLIGAVVAFSTPTRTPPTAPWALLGGALAICAMILPGISGSFILLLVGQYERAVEAVHVRDVGTVGLFALGAVIGLLLFVRVLRWTLVRYHDPTIAALVGFIVGSLPRLWPWTDCLDCLDPRAVAPTGGVGLAIGLGVAGAAGMVVFERWATRPGDPVGS